MKTNKKPPGLPEDWFWKALAVVGTLASIAGLIVALVK
jgi:hypothetical protein